MAPGSYLQSETSNQRMITEAEAAAHCLDLPPAFLPRHQRCLDLPILAMVLLGAALLAFAFAPAPVAPLRASPARASTAVLLETAIPPASRDGARVSVRVATDQELEEVAGLQIDVFAPPEEGPTLLPMLKALYEANQRGVRHSMRQRLTADLRARRAGGSEILIAFESSGDGVGEGAQLLSPAQAVLGCVDVSLRELQLPTHAVAGGAYLSHMCVLESSRRRGIARRLLQSAVLGGHFRGALWRGLTTAGAPLSDRARDGARRRGPLAPRREVQRRGVRALRERRLPAYAGEAALGRLHAGAQVGAPRSGAVLEGAGVFTVNACGCAII